MPALPNHQCNYPGCSRSVPHGQAYCSEHELTKRDYSAYDAKRSIRFYYTRRWRVLRDWYIQAHPLCEMCLSNNRVTPASEVHHVHEVKDGGRPFDRENLMALCHACHMEITEINSNKRHNALQGA